MGLDNYSGIIKIGFGGKLLLGPHYICEDANKIEANSIFNISDENKCPKIEKPHYHYEVKNRNNSNSRSNFKMAIEHASDELKLGKSVLIHSPDDRGIIVVAGTLFKAGAYNTLEDALYAVVKKKASGKPSIELIDIAQESIYDKQ